MKKRSLGQWLALLGNLVICTGLLLHGFEIISKSGLRAFSLIGVVLDGIALFFILKKSEF